jgi:hypothetical protein
MSEQIGVIGQKYENRKSGKRGVLVSRDESKSVLNLLDTNTGDPFTVAFISFKSNWRRATDDSGKVEPVVEEIVEKYKSSDESDTDLIENFEKEVGETREVKFETHPEYDDDLEVLIEGISVLHLIKEPNGIKVEVIPDLYTYSDLKCRVVPGTIHFNSPAPKSLTFLSDYERFGDVLSTIQKAAKVLNLYGYIIE